jgi:hypothetical protein
LHDYTLTVPLFKIKFTPAYQKQVEFSFMLDDFKKFFQGDKNSSQLKTKDAILKI